MSFRSKYPYGAGLICGGLDAITLACAAGMAAVLMREDGAFLAMFQSGAMLVFSAILLWWGLAWRERLYASRRNEPLPMQLLSVGRVLPAWWLGTLFLAVVIPPQSPRGLVLVFVSMGCCLILWQRMLFRLSVSTARRRGYNVEHAVVVGANPCTDRIVRYIEANPQYGTVIDGFLEDDARARSLLAQRGLACLGSISDLETVLRDRVVDVVYVPSPIRMEYDALRRLVWLCEDIGVNVKMVADLFPLRSTSHSASILFKRVGSVPVMHITARRNEEDGRFSGISVWDRLAAAIIIGCASPVLLVAALMIKLESPGPALVTQWQVTRSRWPFRLLRFRSVHSDGPTLSNRMPNTDLTLAGQFLRKHGLDDLPWLFNIAMGNMPSPCKDGVARDYSCRECRMCTRRDLVGNNTEQAVSSAFEINKTVRTAPAYDRRDAPLKGTR